ncbi:MAG: hypothetical protein J7K40_05990 [candidate division Zixibacteria bacterium]|nr:hypothetical protein [candidate division Zixibacteria bacterium]
MMHITGQIFDTDTGDGIEETPVYLDGRVVAVTDNNGGYSFIAAPGRHRFEVRPREFLYVIRDVMITQDSRMIDHATGRPVRKDLQLTRATL